MGELQETLQRQAVVLLFRCTHAHVTPLNSSTGLKCLPADKLPLYGDVLHDSHAEIIARRGLRLWLYGQLDLYYSKEESNAPDLLEPSGDYGPFLRIKPKYKLAMYISTLPCKTYFDIQIHLLALNLA